MGHLHATSRGHGHLHIVPSALLTDHLTGMLRRQQPLAWGRMASQPASLASNSPSSRHRQHPRSHTVHAPGNALVRSIQFKNDHSLDLTGDTVCRCYLDARGEEGDPPAPSAFICTFFLSACSDSFTHALAGGDHRSSYPGPMGASRVSERVSE